MVTTEVPSKPSLSTRWNITSVGTGFEKSSYSLQYSQARLQRRIGMICASRGWSVEARAHATLRAPRTAREIRFNPRCNLVPMEDIIRWLTLEHSPILSASFRTAYGGFSKANGDLAPQPSQQCLASRLTLSIWPLCNLADMDSGFE